MQRREGTKKVYLKKLVELSSKTVGKKPQLEEPTYEQKKWALRRLRHSSKRWRRWSE